MSTFRIDFNRECDKCELSCKKAVTGQSEIPLDRVLLVVISAYPGNNEIRENLTLVDNQSKIEMNAGGFLRLLIRNIFDNDPEISKKYKPFEKWIYFTNALKCSPMKGRERQLIKPSYISTCKETWLDKELAEVAKCPILIASSEAVTSLLGKEHKLNTSREKVFSVGERKAIVTYNPIEWERGAIKVIENKEEIEEEVEKILEVSKDPTSSIKKLVKTRYWKPTPLGSTLWFVKKDLERIKTLVKEYIALRDKS